MFGPYADVLKSPGAMAFSSSGLIARLPLSMFGLAIVFAVEHSTGSYGRAGFTAGAALLGQAVGAPLQARAADTWGQTAMLRPVLAAHAVALAGLTLAVGRSGDVVVIALAVASGATLPQIGALVRARWARLKAGKQHDVPDSPPPPGLHTAYAFESVLDEVVFVTGPPLVTVLATAVDPKAGLLANLAFSVIGGAIFALQRRTDPGPRDRTAGKAGILPVKTMTWVVTAFLFMGGLFGAMEVSAVAFTDEAGSPGAAGLILAMFAGGSLVAGLITGSIQWKTDVQRRFMVGQALLTVAVVPLPFISALSLLGVAAFIAGFAISPTLISGFSLVEATVPASRLTEGLAWVSTALSAGVALGAAAAGPVVDETDASTAFWVLVACGVVATAACVFGRTVERTSTSAA